MSKQTKRTKSSKAQKNTAKDKPKTLPAKITTNNNTDAEKKGAGRPSSYKPEYAEQAFNFSLLGAKDADLARLFDVNVDTIYTWKNQFPEFADALKNGKEIADSQVAKSLYQRAKGYEWVEEQAIKVKVDKDLEEVRVVKVTRRIPPDPTSIIFWLKNRQRDNWRDKIDHAVGGDKDAPPIQAEIKEPADRIAFARKLAFALALGAQELEDQRQREEQEKQKQEATNNKE